MLTLIKLGINVHNDNNIAVEKKMKRLFEAMISSNKTKIRFSKSIVLSAEKKNQCFFARQGQTKGTLFAISSSINYSYAPLKILYLGQLN